MDGGYDDGYRACPCFWGTEPSSLVRKLINIVRVRRGWKVVDLGCGEGKNAIFLSNFGAEVLALDVSDVAIDHAKKLGETVGVIDWRVADAREVHLCDGYFDAVIAYGLLHCLPEQADVERLINKMQRITRAGGFNVLATLNGRNRDLSAHPDLKPCWLSHEWYAEQYRAWDLIDCKDADLTEMHPHNQVWHTHSITRILARKAMK